MANDPTQLQNKLAALRASYGAKLSGYLDELEAVAAPVIGGGAPNQVRQALDGVHARAHKLAGSAETFGFAAVSEMARQLEAFSGTILEEDGIPSSEQCEQLQDLLSALMAAGDE